MNELIREKCDLLVSNTLSIIFAKRLSVLISIVTNAISALASMKAPDSEEEKK
ncbi:MAG: hypothetical protein IK014_01270 [Lachnospiraceae bacterium]|nr:hypothetical protein [Lachnospiraceae bacterium]